MALQGEEVSVPELVGKNYSEIEKQLSDLGLKVHRRASRPSADAPDTVLEQLPKAGETVKTGQRIMVVTSVPGPAGQEVPSTLKKTEDEDAKKIEEMISEKPKRSKNTANSNKKKAETTRDVSANTSNSNSNSADDGTKPGAANKNAPASPAIKPSTAPANRSAPARPSTGDVRPRATPKL
jgi:beta-lactam-binding protein with PASTA domain